MPRNKRPQASEEKRAEIVAVARRLFIETGYEATPMNRLAAEAGIAANTVYWYFDDKDDLLVAVLDEVMSDTWSHYQPISGRPLAERLFWVVDRLQQMSKLVSTVHARAESVPRIEKWHKTFHFFTDSLLRAELESVGSPDADVESEVMIGVFTIEGLLMHPLPDAAQRAVCEVLVARWGAPAH